MRVLVTSKSFGRTAPAAIELLKANGIDIVRGSKSSLTAAEIAAEIAGCDGLIVGNDTVDAAVFAAGNRLRLVHMHGTGLDAIDVDAATECGVLVANAPGANRNAVAELTIGLILVAARAIDKHIDSLKAGRWERSAGHEVSGKTIGMLGLGQIGSRIVELLSGFGVHVVAYDVAPDRAWAQARGIDLRDDAEAVFAEADYLVLALPLTNETRKFVDARRLSLMKPTAVLINTARGGLVDDAALCDAVRDKRIAGAALDVFDPEPLRADSPLRNLGITLTPHLAATSIETAAEVSMIVARNVVDILVHQRIDSAVNPQALANRSRTAAR